MLSFSCAVGKPVVNVNVQDEESTAEEGALMHVRLSSSGETIEFSDKARPNQDSGGADVKGHLPLDDTLRAILTATDTLEIIVDGHTQRYDMDGAAEPAAAMIAACDAPKPASDLDVTLTNKTKRPLQSFVWSEPGRITSRAVMNSIPDRSHRGQAGHSPSPTGARSAHTT
jgi:hypothetical protein